MYTEIFSIIAPVFICAAIGYGWARAKIPFEGEFISRLVMNIGAPCLVIGTLGKVEMSSQSMALIALATLAVLIITAIFAALICRLFTLSYRVYVAPLIFPNTINMGFPICLFAFGEDGLAAAVGVYLVISLIQFTFGVVLVSGENNWRQSLKSPIVFSALIAGGLIFTGTHLPLWLENSLTLVGSMSIPLMLITLGFSLSTLKISSFPVSASLATVRVAGGALVGYLVANLLSLEGTSRGVLIVQSAMPAAVFNYLMAYRYHRSPEIVASLVVMSTLVSFATLPFLLWFVL